MSPKNDINNYLEEALRPEAIKKLNSYLEKEGITNLFYLVNEFNKRKDGHKWTYLISVAKEMGIEDKEEIIETATDMFIEINNFIRAQSDNGSRQSFYHRKKIMKQKTGHKIF